MLNVDISDALSERDKVLNSLKNPTNSWKKIN
jgi:hypothetical protein